MIRPDKELINQLEKELYHLKHCKIKESHIHWCDIRDIARDAWDLTLPDNYYDVRKNVIYATDPRNHIVEYTEKEQEMLKKQETKNE